MLANKTHAGINMKLVLNQTTKNKRKIIYTSACTNADVLDKPLTMLQVQHLPFQLILNHVNQGQFTANTLISDENDICYIS